MPAAPPPADPDLRLDGLSPAEMEAVQRRLAARLDLGPCDLSRIRTVGGVDVTYDGDAAVAAVVVLDGTRVVERVVVSAAATVPYVSGFLAFREMGAVLEAVARLSAPPDAFAFDGNGTLHERRCGLASHAFFFLGRPTFGIAKKPHIGVHAEPGPRAGDRAPVLDRGELVGHCLRTRDGVRPVYVSAGGGMAQDQAVELACRFVHPASRVPLVTALPDRLSREHVRALRGGGPAGPAP